MKNLEVQIPGSSQDEEEEEVLSSCSEGDVEEDDSVASEDELELLPSPGTGTGAAKHKPGVYKTCQLPSVEDVPLNVTQEHAAEAESLLPMLEGPLPQLGGSSVLVSAYASSYTGTQRAAESALYKTGLCIDRQDFRRALPWAASSWGLSRFLYRCPMDTDDEFDDKIVSHASKMYSDLRMRVKNRLRAVIQRAKDSPDTRQQLLDEKEKEILEAHDEGSRKRREGNLAGALAAYRKVLSLRLTAVGPNHPYTALAHSFVATVLRDMGDIGGALEELKLALEIQTKTLGPDHLHVAGSRNNIGALLRQLGKPEEAVAEHRAALEILRVHSKTTPPQLIAEVREHIGHALKHMNDIKGAVSEYRQVLQIHEQVCGKDHPKTQRLRERLHALDSSYAAPWCLRQAGLEEGTDVGEWVCPGCGCENGESVAACVRCSYRRPLSKDGVVQIFENMVFVFSGVIPRSIHPSAWKEWRCAEQHGARLLEDVTDGVTHVIYREQYEQSEKVIRAARISGVKIVPAKWFYSCLRMGVLLDADLYNLRSKGEFHHIKLGRMPLEASRRCRRSHSCPGARWELQTSSGSGSCSPTLPPPKPMVASIPTLTSPKHGMQKRRNIKGLSIVSTAIPEACVRSPMARSPRGNVHTPVPVRPETPCITPHSLVTPRNLLLLSEEMWTPRAGLRLPETMSSAFSQVAPPSLNSPTPRVPHMPSLGSLSSSGNMDSDPLSNSGRRLPTTTWARAAMARNTFARLATQNNQERASPDGRGAFPSAFVSSPPQTPPTPSTPGGGLRILVYKGSNGAMASPHIRGNMQTSPEGEDVETSSSTSSHPVQREFVPPHTSPTSPGLPPRHAMRSKTMTSMLAYRNGAYGIQSPPHSKSPPCPTTYQHFKSPTLPTSHRKPFIAPPSRFMKNVDCALPPSSLTRAQQQPQQQHQQQQQQQQAPPQQHHQPDADIPNISSLSDIDTASSASFGDDDDKERHAVQSSVNSITSLGSAGKLADTPGRAVHTTSTTATTSYTCHGDVSLSLDDMDTVGSSTSSKGGRGKGPLQRHASNGSSCCSAPGAPMATKA